MDYDFSKRKRSTDKIIFALTLNQKKMTERVVIGEAAETRRQLENKTGKVYYDKTRPLGQLLLDFESDKDNQWSMNTPKLSESYNKIFPFERERWKIAATISDFLHGKYESNEPSTMFAAIRTWEEYLICYYENYGKALLTNRLNLLYRPFSLYAEKKLWQETAADASSQAVHDEESQIELWYPMSKRPFECIVAYDSLQPLISYYLHKIEEWDAIFQECQICGRYFLAPNRYYRLCSDDCRKVQAVQSKREFDEKVKDDSLEQCYETAYFYWYNRLRKLRRAKSPDTGKISAVTEAFEIFRKEAIERKGMVKHGAMRLDDFSSWLAERQSELDRLMN